MSDLYTVTVLANTGHTVELRLDIIHPDVVDIPVSPSFATLLVEDEFAPGAAAYKAWWKAWVARDPAADPGPLYRQLELVDLAHLPRTQSEPPTGMTWDDLDAITDRSGPSLLGSGVLRITVDDPGYLAHLVPGMTWNSTAWNEQEDGPTAFGVPGEPRTWARGEGSGEG